MSNGGYRAQEPDFSPDGKRLVFVGQKLCSATPGRKRLAILAVGLRDVCARMLLNTCHRSFIPYSPVFSPRGNRVIFVRRDNPQNVGVVSRLQLMNLRGGLLPGAPRHRGGEFSPTWQALR